MSARGRFSNPLNLARLLVIDGCSASALPVLKELRPGAETMTLNIDKEFQALIPPLTEEERSALELSLLTDGCRDALVVWNGTLIDGHNRYAICQQHGIPFQIVELDFPDRNAVIVWMIQNQLGRRNITDYTRGRLALRLKDAIATQAKARQKSTQFGSDAVVENFPPPSKTRDELGKIADLSGKTIAKVETIERAAPDAIKQAAEREEISIHKAYELTKALETVKAANPKFYEETVDRGHITNLDGEDVPLTEADPTLIRVIASEDEYERVKRQEQYVADKLAEKETKRQKIAERIERAQLPDAKYRVIYADPPWQYGNTMPEYFNEQADHYPLMPMSELMALPVAALAEPDAVLFLWVTSPILADAFPLIAAWDFTYKSSFIWDKQKHNMGHYNSVRHELLLVCTRGSCQPDTRRLFDSVVSEPRGSHSRKPVTFRTIIDTLYPHGKRIELFAREHVPGWDVFGNEVV